MQDSDGVQTLTIKCVRTISVVELEFLFFSDLGKPSQMVQEKIVLSGQVYLKPKDGLSFIVIAVRLS